MEQTTTIRTQLCVTVTPSKQGRTTFWLVNCSDECDEVRGVKPISRRKGAWFAQDHINTAHNGVGELRVRTQKNKYA
jgi:hypothetical protein